MLVKYEFLKILRKKSTLIVMVASLLVTAFLFGLPIMQFQTYNQDGIIKGFEGIKSLLRIFHPHPASGPLPLLGRYLIFLVGRVLKGEGFETNILSL